MAWGRVRFSARSAIAQTPGAFPVRFRVDEDIGELEGGSQCLLHGLRDVVGRGQGRASIDTHLQVHEVLGPRLL